MRAYFLACSVSLAMTSIANAAITNGDFETGTIAGWSSVGSASAKTAALGVTPTDGTFMGYIESTGNFTAGAPAVIAGLGVSGASVLGLGQGPPTNGSGIYQSISVSAGQTLTFNWNFLTDELDQDPQYNDFTFFEVDGTPFLLASRNASTYNIVSPPPGFDGQTGWAGYSYLFTSGGSHTIGFAVFNEVDAGHNSVLLMDSFLLSNVPEPCTALLGTLVAVPRRRRSIQA